MGKIKNEINLPLKSAVAFLNLRGPVYLRALSWANTSAAILEGETLVIERPKRSHQLTQWHSWLSEQTQWKGLRDTLVKPKPKPWRLRPGGSQSRHVCESVITSSSTLGRTREHHETARIIGLRCSPPADSQENICISFRLFSRSVILWGAAGAWQWARAERGVADAGSHRERQSKLSSHATARADWRVGAAGSQELCQRAGWNTERAKRERERERERTRRERERERERESILLYSSTLATECKPTWCSVGKKCVWIPLQLSTV